MKALVCGGRDFSSMADVYRVLDGMKISCIIQGGAAGADALARQWAMQKSISLVTEFAQWDKEGPAAGPLRNQRMLDLWKPDFVVAFPGGRGTADMVRRAKKAGLRVIESGLSPTPSEKP